MLIANHTNTPSAAELVTVTLSERVHLTATKATLLLLVRQLYLSLRSRRSQGQWRKKL